MTDLDAGIRRHLYDGAMRRGRPPTIAELASAASITAHEVRDGLGRLAAARVVVLQPETSEILMAPPFSAVPTPFVVETSRHASYANCAWDALGVSIMLRQPARVVSACGCCGQALTLDVSPDHPPDDTAVIHFAVPAAGWWQDIVFT